MSPFIASFWKEVTFFSPPRRNRRFLPVGREKQEEEGEAPAVCRGERGVHRLAARGMKLR